MKETKTFFISGHRDVTDEEFSAFYKVAIQQAIKDYDASFIMGDYSGVDIMGQNYLVDELNYDINKVTVCHMGDTPMNINPKITRRISNFNDDIHRDSFMTKNSDADIAFIRVGKEDSGTAQNILRRCTFVDANDKVKNYSIFFGF